MPHTVTRLSVIITALNLAGSLLSFLGAGFIIITYLILPKKSHFRHVLILNLATADCSNGLNLFASSLYILLTKHGLSEGSLCVTNGFIGQFTVQATDCSILAMTIAIVLKITRLELQTAHVIWSKKKVVLVTLGIWMLPATTSVIALVKGWYGPASGSWCWIVESPGYLRYALTHGWRLSFIITEVALYIYLYAFLTKHYRNISEAVSPKASENNSTLYIDASHNHKSVQRVLLLNVYPVAYIILWIPGIVNRLIELSGHTSGITQALQASTQFVGLANAITYGWNEGIAKQLYAKLNISNKSSRMEQADVNVFPPAGLATS